MEGESVLMSDIDDEIVLVLTHPFGDIEVSMKQWIATGPGPRDLVRPIAAKRRTTGEPLPLDVIPLQYQNNEESRALISRGLLANPWPKK